MIRFRFVFWLLILTSCLFWLPVRGQQPVKFSGDSTKFIGELNQLFSTLSDADRKIVEQEMVRFVQNWNAEKFDPAKKKVIYRIGNHLLRKKMRPFPDVYQYLKALDDFLAANRPDPLFFGWSDILEKLADSKSARNMTVFIDQTSRLFESNLLYESPSTAWKATTNDFSFSYDTVPVILVNTTDLICYSNRDSLTIKQTRGRYYPLTSRWIGSGGRVDWKRAGLDPDKVFALLSDYGIQMKFSTYTADSAEFYNKKYFSSALLGKLTDKIQADVAEERASYPRFASYDDYLGIPGIFNNIDFYGGFSMEGARVIGFGTDQRDAVIIFKRNGKEFVTARSRNFIIRPDRINSGSASVSIYHENDSIYHSGLQLKYIDELKELSLNKDERTKVVSPWFDSWHGIEIYSEAIYWKTGSGSISFEVMRGPGDEGRSLFESNQYYSLERYERLRGIDDVNPLNVIRNFTERKKSKEFTLDELVKYMQKPPDQVEGLLLLLSARGFLIYDRDDKRTVVKEKLLHYVDSKNGKSDYDILIINSSVTGKSNALLNLENFDLKILGVDRVLLSDSQQVYIYPRYGELVMQQDRNFSFSGKVEAGLFDFYTTGCSFEYGAFKLHMPEIDTMEFYTRGNKKDPRTGEYPLVKVRSQINDLNGELLIDAPDNKSGRNVLPEYPIFINKGTTWVNWDKPVVHNGVYDRERFFFTVNPFTLASLDKMVPDSLKFEGQLTSAGIFPDIREPLRIQPDYSLGFETETPPEGLPVYGGKGTFISRIDLSNQGLKGAGTVRYLNSSSESDEFLFFPDSMQTTARSFEMAEQMDAVEYPAVSGDSVRQKWYPYQDSLTLFTLGKKEARMYKDQSTFSGVLSLTPEGMSGSGTIRIRDAEMDSKGFHFKQHSFDALIANFRIKSYDLAALSISTSNYRTHFDFEERRGEFKSNVGISRIEFPFNQYICSMDRFDWMIDNEEINLTNEAAQPGAVDGMSLADLIDVGYTGSEFVSISPKQDSLRFFALRAKYNLRTSVINAEDVRIIKVADAAIFPDSGKVRILKDARMEQLKNANIIANTSTRFHSFYNADAAIATRHSYSAKGYYDYVDLAGQHQQIWMPLIAVDSAGSTYAKGVVGDTAQFRIHPAVGFAGDVLLYAPDSLLTFDGGFKPMADCSPVKPEYVRFTSRVNPADVKLPVDPQPKNRMHENLTAGLMMSNTLGRIYPLFFEKRTSFSDTVMVDASGFLSYRASDESFLIAPAPGTAGMASSLAMNTASCVLSGTGPVNTGMNAGNLRMEAWGTVTHYILPDSTGMKAAIAFNFPFNEPALEKLVQHLQSINLAGALLLNTPFSTAMDYLVKKEDRNNLRTEIEQFGRFRKFPDELKRTLFLADVNLVWDTAQRAWISYGPIAVGVAGNQMIAKVAEGKIEMAKKRNGDDITLYLKFTEDDWYFFNYRNNILQTISSNLEYNDLIIQAQQDAAEQKRIDKEAKGFRYTISTDRKKRDFLRKYETPEE